MHPRTRAEPTNGCQILSQIGNRIFSDLIAKLANWLIRRQRITRDAPRLAAARRHLGGSQPATPNPHATNAAIEPGRPARLRGVDWPDLQCVF